MDLALACYEGNISPACRFNFYAKAESDVLAAGQHQGSTRKRHQKKTRSQGTFTAKRSRTFRAPQSRPSPSRLLATNDAELELVHLQEIVFRDAEQWKLVGGYVAFRHAGLNDVELEIHRQEPAHFSQR
jgi:hypothetical protein